MTGAAPVSARLKRQLGASIPGRRSTTYHASAVKQGHGPGEVVWRYCDFKSKNFGYLDNVDGKLLAWTVVIEGPSDEAT